MRARGPARRWCSSTPGIRWRAVSRPLRELKAFEKVALEPGESRRVTLRVPVERLGFHLDDGTYVVEPGEIQVFLGTSSAADPVGSVEIFEELRLRPGERRAAALRSPL